MRRLLLSLWFRLVLGFGLILAAALGSVSLYISSAAEREGENFERRQETVRLGRIHRLVSRTYAAQGTGGDRERRELQSTLERMGPLVGRRIVVRDEEGQVVGDSHWRQAPPWSRLNRGDRDRGDHSYPIVVDDRQVGFIELGELGPELGSGLGTEPGPAAPGAAPDEPRISHLVSSINTYLLWTGLAAGLGGLLLVSLVSRQLLAPVQALGAAASRLGCGDLSQRAAGSGPTEIKELAHSFNRMAGSLQAAEEQRRSLAADVAHELRTPLFNIQGYLEAIKDGLLEPSAETIDTIHGQALHLGRLVEDLRLLAQAEAGALHLDMELDSLDDVVARSVEAARPRAEANGVSLALYFNHAAAPQERVLAVMDRTRIAQVVSNLLDNAVQHSPAGGRVTVDVMAKAAAPAPGLASADLITVTVADEGEGIPPEDIPLVFERFYRVDPSRSRATGGVGLGLTIAKRLVEAHGGAVWAESPGQDGATVGFELPVSGER